MTSTYSTSLRLELMGTGDQSGTWGTTTNTNLGTLLEQAITGYVAVAMADSNQTLTASNGASDQARNAVVESTGTLTGTKNVVVPTAEKIYLYKNSTSGGYAITIKTSAGSGVAVPAGEARWVYCDGTDVVDGLGTLGVTFGGTGAATASGARTALGLAIGSNVQAYNAYLAAIAALTPTDSKFIVGNGSTWVAESGSTLRTSIGLGSLATASTVNNDNWSGTDLSVANGGTGSSTAANARTALGLAIGSDVQAYDDDTTKNDVENTFTADQVINSDGSSSTPSDMALTLSGAFGGGLHLKDGTNDHSWYTNSGTMVYGYSTSDGSPTTYLSISSSGLTTVSRLSVTDNGGYSLASVFNAYPVYSNTTGSSANVFCYSGNPASDGDIVRSTSSERYKKEFAPISQEEINALLSLEPFTYVHLGEEDLGRRFGLSAEAVHRSGLVGAVNYMWLDEEAEKPPHWSDEQYADYVAEFGTEHVPDNVEYARLVPILLAHVKDLTARVEELENA